MKNLFKFELALLIIIDLVYLYSGITQRYIYIDHVHFCLSLAHLFLGPLQFIPALVLLRKTAHRKNKHFVIYFILAMATLLIFTLNVNIYFDEIVFIKNSTYIQIFAWLLAHYFVFVLYHLNKKNP